MENKTTFDLIIIGGGPAGLTAAIYASRANLSTLILERGAPGGKIVKTFQIENWSGDISISGPELAMRMFKHAKNFGAEYRYGDVKDITSENNYHIVHLEGDKKLSAKSIIIATGMVEKVPEEVNGIDMFEHRGVSYCAICDGPLFKGKPMAIIGGGNSALAESLFLSQFAPKVYVFLRRPDSLIAEEKLIAEVKAKSNIEMIYNAQVKKLHGDKFLEKAEVQVGNEIKTFEFAALFPYIGQKPVTDFVKKLGITDQWGFIHTNELMETKIKNIFAAGDVRAKEIRQIATAVSDGAIAAKIIASRL